MPIASRLLRRVLALLLPGAVSSAPAVAAETPPPRTLSALILRLDRDPELRRRFARDPRGTLRGIGIDPAPFALPESLKAGEIESLLARARAAGGAVLSADATDAVDAARPRRAPPAPVYGPPPGPLPSPAPRPPAPFPPPAAEPPVGPPVAVYGPPPPRRP